MVKTANSYLKSTGYPKPFLKWAGGKTQLLEEIHKRLPENIKKTRKDGKKGIIDKYFEPFVGGGAVFFCLTSCYDIRHAYLGDTNRDFILTYNIIKYKPHDLIDKLKDLENKYKHEKSTPKERKKLFKDKRDDFNIMHDVNPYGLSDEHVTIASLMIFLNKTCFNGLYRVNKNNKFNVPFANPKNPLICDEKNIIAVSKKLKGVELFVGDYSKSIVGMDKKSLVYFDPPYRPINGKKSFEGYSKSDFNDNHQKELAIFCKKIRKRGAKFILSNSDPHNYDENDNFFDELYKDFNVDRIYAKRFINSNGKKRGPITEILVSNY